MISLNRQNLLVDWVREGKPSLYLGSRTTRVIPIDQWLRRQENSAELVDLTGMPTQLEMVNGELLRVRGPVTWKEARSFCQDNERDLGAWPTEDLATVLGGVCTSATGERTFGFGPLRERVRRVRYLNHEGVVSELYRDQFLQDHPAFSTDAAQEILGNYQKTYEQYEDFKNAPYPRLRYQTDLMVGTEGQLGVLLEADLETIPMKETAFIMVRLPRWEDSFGRHHQIYSQVQRFKGFIYACELIDSNCAKLLGRESRLSDEFDHLLVEIASSEIESWVDDLLNQVSGVREGDLFVLPESKVRWIRQTVPRRIGEKMMSESLDKLGTDIQVKAIHFDQLLDAYRELASGPMQYMLFGHFGNAHLHFNIFPEPEDKAFVEARFHELYRKVSDWQGSPFAEHGIGVTKQAYVRSFYGKPHYEMFRHLKKQFDPKNQFFPHGFMSMESSNKTGSDL